MLVNIHTPRKSLTLLVILMLGTSTFGQVWSLQQCIDTALIQNKSLQVSKANMELNTEKNGEAKANLIPKVILLGDYKYFMDLPTQLMPLSVFGGPDGQFKVAQFGVPHNINASVQLRAPIYNSQIYGAIEATKIGMELSEIQHQKSEDELILEITYLYYNAQVLEHQLSFIDSNLVSSTKLLTTLQLVEEQLLAKGTDVDRVALQVEQLQSNREQVENRIAQVLNGLKFMMGISLDQQISIDSHIEYSTGGQLDLNYNLDFQLATTRSKLLSTELTTLKRSKLPSVSLYGSYGTTGFGYDQEPNRFLDFYAQGFAGLNITYPLFNGTVTSRKIKQKKIEISSSGLQLSLIKDKNDMQIANARLERTIAERRVNTSQSQIELAQSIYDQTTVQYYHGVSTISEIISTSITLRETQQENLTAIIEYQKADLSLKSLTGNIKE